MDNTIGAEQDPYQEEKLHHNLSLDINQDGMDPDYHASPSRTREQEHRLDDDLALLQVERQVSQEASRAGDDHNGTRPSMSLARSRSRRTDPVDDFDVSTNPIHERTQVYKPPENPTTKLSKFFKRIHESNWLVRYFTYIIPLALLLLIPVLLGRFRYQHSDNVNVGGVYLLWFGVWLEILWLTLWCGRILAKCLPFPMGLLSSLFTNNSKKWRDLGKQLEVPASLFFWAIAVEVSWLPTMQHHLIPSLNGQTPEWIFTVNKIIVSILVGFVLNFVEKIIIQLIAISFHLRTYADRIEINKFQIGSLVKLYIYSKEKIGQEDSDFEDRPSGAASGTRTPMQYVEQAQRNFLHGFRKAGDAAGKVAGDFTGKQVMKSTHPHQVVLALLNSTSGSQVLARRLYRTFVREDSDSVDADDLRHAFENDDEADAAFTMFDKDMNGDITMEELEAVCVEIGRERKSITASLKDLDSVVSKLDGILLFVVICVTILVFITLISTSASGVLTSAGSSVLALSWLFSATAQEFLQSIIFVFVKHPFDVGDRVSVYGNTGSQLKGDDYFVKEISLLYTEFKKMEGHVVQAPNSYLNTLFILNMRRSGGLAEAVPIVIKFGTTLEQIEGLRESLLEFVRSEKREYQANILTEVRDVTEAYSVSMNIVFFYKTNWQNELLRLQRRNKFICALMVSMQENGIEGPRPGQKANFPFYISQHNSSNGGMDGPSNGGPDRPLSTVAEEKAIGGGAPISRTRGGSVMRTHPSILRRRGDSVSSMAKRVDFSLGMRGMASADMPGDVHDDVTQPPVPQLRSISAQRTQRQRESMEREIERKRSGSIASATGRDAGPAPFGLNRSSTSDSTNSQKRSLHRNRFFGNKDRADPEAMMEQGMAPIQEMGQSPAGPSSAAAAPRIDARSGLVSPQAIRFESGSSSQGEVPKPSNLRQTMSNVSTAGEQGSAATKEDPAIEMRTLR